MNEENIKETVDNFINKSLYHYAIMINGDWGCGKTYFIKEILIPHIRNSEYKDAKGEKRNVDINYISLYGIRDISDISDKLCAQAIEDTVKKVGDSRKPSIRPIKKLVKSEKSFQVVSTVAGIAAKALMKKAEVGDKDDLKKFLALFPNFNDNVIIFDDLERCSCDINEVLGYINNFVEHSNAKVIVIANENEIGKNQTDNLNELQMLVAMNHQIKIETETKTASTEDENELSKLSITPEELETRKNEIFNNLEKYRRIKEKVIGETITYEPDLKTVYSSLISTNVSNQHLQEVLLREVDTFVGYANKDNHKNIRTFQFFLEKVNCIFDIIENKYATTHKEIVDYCYRTSICWKSGRKNQPVWINNEKFGYQQLGESLITGQLYGYRFIDDFVRESLIDRKKAEEALEQHEMQVKEEERYKNDPSKLIKTWYHAEDEQVEQWINTIIENVENDFYSTALYPGLIRDLATMEAYGLFHDLIEKALLTIVEHIRTMDKRKIKPLSDEHIFLRGKEGELFNIYMNQIKAIVAEKENEAQRECYLEIIGDYSIDWAREIVDTIAGDSVIKGWSCFYWIPPEKIIYRLIRSNNEELYYFRALLDCFYNGPYYKNVSDDYDHLVELKKRMKEIVKTDFGKIKTQVMEWIEYDLEKYLRRYPQYTPDDSIIIEEP